MYQTKALGAPLAKLRADSISWSWHKIRLRHPILLPSQRFAAHDGYPRYVFVTICLLTISRWVSSKATRACWHHLHVLNRMLAIIGKRRPNIWGCEGKHELIWSTTVDNNLVEQNQLMTYDTAATFNMRRSSSDVLLSLRWVPFLESIHGPEVLHDTSGIARLEELHFCQAMTTGREQSLVNQLFLDWWSWHPLKTL